MVHAEYKCIGIAPSTPAKGHGSVECGGAASQADGGRFAMGNTEEDQIVKVLGVAERGTQADGPFDHGTGTGWVRATRGHQYEDAQRRGNPVVLLHAEPTGAVSKAFAAAYRHLDKISRAPTSTDHTIYGTSSSSPRTFYTHHMAAHSAAVVYADTATLHNVAAAASFQISIGLVP